MKTRTTAMFGIELPIFAFSHCRDVVAEVSKAGGMLWPQIVDLVAPVPVLAAGGIGRGRQMAAALALGADGIWFGDLQHETSVRAVVRGMIEEFVDAVERLGSLVNDDA